MSRMPPRAHFISLPDDCILQLFRFSPVPDVVTLRQTCKRLDALSRSHTTWRSCLERWSDEGRIPHLPLTDLETSAENLEELVTRYFRLKWRMHRKDIAVQCLQAHKLETPPIRDASQLPTPHISQVWPTHSGQEEYWRTGQWIAPGFLLIGSLVRPTDSQVEYGCISLWHLGHDIQSVVPSRLPVTAYRIPSLHGSAADVTISRCPIAGEKNTYLVLVGTWTRTSWALIKLRLPLQSQESASCEEISALSFARILRKTALDMHGDFIAFLSDIAGSLGSIFLWNWREATCFRFKVHSAHDQNGSSTKDGSAPILIAPPYLIYIRTHTSTIHVLPIPTLYLSPLASYDPTDRPKESLPCWSARLPCRATANGGFQLSLVKNDLGKSVTSAGAVTVNIDYCMPRFCASARLVISKGKTHQEIRPGQTVTFNFRAEIRDIVSKPNADMVIGVSSIPGSVGWYTPEELDVLLRRVIKLQHESSDSDVGEDDRRVPVSRSELQTRIAIDPMLGRVCVLPDGYPGLYLVDVYKK